MTCLKDSTRPVQGAIVGALSSFVDRLSLLNPNNAVSKSASAIQDLSRVVDELEKVLHFSLGSIDTSSYDCYNWCSNKSYNISF